MARSRFSKEVEVTNTRNRVDVRVNEGEGDSHSHKRLIWWCATYIFLAILALIMFLAWAMRKHLGFAWEDHENLVGSINYHGTFMIVSFMLLNGVADVLYRMCRNSNRLSVKIAHGTIQLLGFCFVVTALCAIFWWHDAKRIPNMSSAHSWIGLLVVLLYSLQLLIGFCGLLWPGFKAQVRQNYLSYHKFTGRSIFLLGMANILIGINKVSGGSTVMNCLALIVILYAINGGYILGTDSFAAGAENGGGADGADGGGYGYEETVVERRESRRSGGNIAPDEAGYINVSGTQGTGQYQTMADDPAIKEALAVGRDSFNKFHDRLERKKNVDIADIVNPTTTVTD